MSRAACVWWANKKGTELLAWLLEERTFFQGTEPSESWNRAIQNTCVFQSDSETHTKKAQNWCRSCSSVKKVDLEKLTQKASWEINQWPHHRTDSLTLVHYQAIILGIYHDISASWTRARPIIIIFPIKERLVAKCLHSSVLHIKVFWHSEHQNCPHKLLAITFVKEQYWQNQQHTESYRSHKTSPENQKDRRWYLSYTAFCLVREFSPRLGLLLAKLWGLVSYEKANNSWVNNQAGISSLHWPQDRHRLRMQLRKHLNVFKKDCFSFFPPFFLFIYPGWCLKLAALKSLKKKIMHSVVRQESAIRAVSTVTTCLS